MKFQKKDAWNYIRRKKGMLKNAYVREKKR